MCKAFLLIIICCKNLVSAIQACNEGSIRGCESISPDWTTNSNELAAQSESDDQTEKLNSKVDEFTTVTPFSPQHGDM